MSNGNLPAVSKFEMIKSLVKSKQNTILLALILGLAAGGYWWYTKPAPSAANYKDKDVAGLVDKGVKQMTMEEALNQPEGTLVLVEATSQSGKNFGNFTLLNQAPYTGPGTTGWTIYVPSTAKGADSVKGVSRSTSYHILVKGQVSSYKGAKQIKADEIVIKQ